MQQENPHEILVSIICDCYNHEKYIRACLDGFVMQECNFQFEVLIHDDASTDNSAAIIKEHEEKYPHIIKPIYQTINQYSSGENIWKNFQFPRANGKYIAICEGDDYWTDPLKLQKQVDFLEINEDYGLVITNVDFYYQEYNKFEKSFLTLQRFIENSNFERFLHRKSYMSPCTWLCRKELIQNKISNLHLYSDGTYILFADFLVNTKVQYLPEVTAVYRIINESASHSKSQFKLYKREIGLYKSDVYLCQNFSRLDLLESLKEDHLTRLSNIIKEAMLSNSEYYQIIDDILFYDKDMIHEILRVKILETSHLKQENGNLKNYINSIKTSKAYLIGNKILSPLRKILSK